MINAKGKTAEFLKSLRNALKPKTVFILVAGIFVIALLGRNLKDVALVALLAVMASYSTVYKRIIRVSGAVELVTLGTVIIGAAYGPVLGAVFGVVTTLAAGITSTGFNAFTALSALARGISGAVSFYMSGTLSITGLGMLSVLIENVIYQPIYLLSGDVEAKLSSAYYAVVNTLFNFMVFSFFGELLLKFARF